MKSVLGNYIDYGSDERLKIKNAVATAEGAISVFMSESDITAAFSRCLVVGYGRCGRALAKRLSALGAYVTVAARSPVSRVDAMCDGFNVKTIDNCLTNIYDAVFNTVPSEIFDVKDALRLNDALYIEIASLPGGMSTDARAVLGENYIKAAALPGKTAPRSSGIYIAETINELIAERK